MTVVDEHGRERTFRLRGKQATSAQLRRLVDDVRDGGGVVGIFYPLQKSERRR